MPTREGILSEEVGMASDGHKAEDSSSAASQAATDPRSSLARPSARSEDVPGPGGPVQVLVKYGLVTQEQLDAAIKRQGDKPGLSILRMLVKSGVVDEVQALQAVAGYCKFPFMRCQSS